MPRRCIKCRDEHAAGECKRKTPTDEGEPFCVNCGQAGHPANATSCEVYKRHSANIEKRKRSVATPPRPFTSTPARWANHSDNYNQNFPDFLNNPRRSITQAQSQAVAAVNSSEYRSSLTQTQSRRVDAHNTSDFGRLLNISDEIMSIPGMDETMRLLDQLLADLKAATPLQRLRILFD
jgi:hypothetical protein